MHNELRAESEGETVISELYPYSDTFRIISRLRLLKILILLSVEEKIAK